MKQNFIIAPSILAANAMHLGEEISHVLSAGADWVHVDVMDNHFVPNLTFGPHIVESIRRYGITAPLDVHLMIAPVADMIKAFAKAGATYITFHVDAVDDIQETIALIRQYGCQPGVVFNPEIALGNLADYIHEIDLVLVMSVQAGFGGQSFMPETLEKVKNIRQLIDQQKLTTRLEIDGGINAHNIAQAAAAGADTFVIGSALFKTEHYESAIAEFHQRLNTVKSI